MALLVLSLIVLLAAAIETTARFGSQSEGVRVGGRVTGYDSQIETSARTGSTTIYLLKFTYEAEGGTFSGRWQVPDKSWIQSVPTGTQITIIYPPGSASLGHPVGEPFDSAVTQETIPFILLAGFTSLLLIVIAIVLLRGVRRGR